MPGMTMTEQILAKHAGKSHVDPGDNIWVDVDVLKTQIGKAVHSSVVIPATYEPWYPEWLDFVNVALQNCIIGKITAEAACDQMTDKAVTLATHA